MSSPSKSQRKELLRVQEHDAQIASELQRERRLGEDVSWRGVGERVLQIREISTFSHGRVWDVRRVADDLKLYVSELNPKKPGYLYPGYLNIDIEAPRLTRLLSSLASAKVSSLLPSCANIGLDGTTTSIELRSGFASVAFSWWELGPPEWSEFTQLVRQAVSELKMLSNQQVGNSF